MVTNISSCHKCGCFCSASFLNSPSYSLVLGGYGIEIVESFPVIHHVVINVTRLKLKQ
jgi:hypothetical protein